MAFLTSPAFVAAPDQPQSATVPILEILPDLDEVVMTRPFLPTPSFSQLGNPSSATTI